jgi:SAM-dependent methyltransferase
MWTLPPGWEGKKSSKGKWYFWSEATQGKPTWKYPSWHAEVAATYNAHLMADPQSSLFRSCQNFCKSVVLNVWLLTGASPVLDIACGKGGDCSKVADAYEYVGVDVAEGALAEAQRRFPTKTFVLGNFCEHDFAPRLGRTFSAAWCSFALHYGAYELDITLRHIAQALREGALFLAITLDDSVEERHPRGFGPLRISKWEHRDPGPLGIAHADRQCFVSFAGSFDELPEPVISVHQMQAACAASGFELVRTELLGSSVQQAFDWAESSDSQSLRAKMLDIRGKYRDAFLWDSTHWEFANCYRTWLLKRLP